MITVSGTAGTNRFENCDFQNADSAISVVSSGGGLNEIEHCSFRDGADGIKMRVYGGTTPQSNQIMNCTFSNLTSRAIYGEAQGQLGDCGRAVTNGLLSLVVKNCLFNDVSNGCNLKIFGEAFTCNPVQSASGCGSANSQIAGNSFCNVTNTALLMDYGYPADTGTSVIMNNTVVNAATGISTQDPWDTTVQNCIFVGCTAATRRTGSLSLNVQYNDYFNNATNFIAYPVPYGQIMIQNANGTPCDLYYNIFQDPRFVGTANFHLTASSPCIDAGNPDTNYWDACVGMCGLSLGTVVNDMGAYGGPEACGWFSSCPPPVITVQPQDQVGCLSHSATFTVGASGNGSLSYLWYFNTNTPISWATNASLTLTNLKGTNGGMYSVIVSDQNGSTNSRYAQLTLYDPYTEIEVEPYFDTYIVAGLYIAGQPTSNYVLKYTTDLSKPWATWMPLTNITMGSSGWFFFLDEESPYASYRFYGAKLKP